MPQPLPVYVVHSDALLERRAPLERALAALEWTAVWVREPEATVGSYLSRRVHPAVSRAQASVYFKHLEVWARIAASSEPFAFVLEDDPVFPPGFAALFATYLAAVPLDAQAVFFGASCGLEAPARQDNPRFAPATRTRSMSAYAVTPAWCREILRDLARARVTQPVDLAVDAVIRRRSLPAYWSVPALVQNGSESGRFTRAVTKGAWRSHFLVRTARRLGRLAGIRSDR